MCAVRQTGMRYAGGINMDIRLDEGYWFGLGVFETIAVENGRAVLLEEHLKRLKKGMSFFSLKNVVSRQLILNYLHKNPMEHGALKIAVSQENIILEHRQNLYQEEDYKRGFRVRFSQVMRNESSPFTYFKTFNYGDSILEKRTALSSGYDECIFCNSRGEICEGATSNIFFVKGGKIYSPKLECGLLQGVIRDYIYQNEKVTDTVILKNEVDKFDECFVTNSLMGIMPVVEFEGHKFLSKDIGYLLMHKYRLYINNYI